MKGLFEQAYRWGVETEGSTRAAALLRMGVVAIVWSKWGSLMLLSRTLENGNWPVAILFFIATPLAFFGVLTRLSTALTAACVGYLVYSVSHHHHSVLLASVCVLLALTPCGRSYSFDRWWALRAAGAPLAERGNLWAVRLMALQVCAIYFWAAYDKCHVGFLGGARMQHYVMFFYTGSDPIDHLAWVAPVTMALAVGTVALEFTLAFGLLFRRFRGRLIIAGMLLHGVMYATLNIATFTATMWILYLAFLDADEVHDFIDRLQR